MFCLSGRGSNLSCEVFPPYEASDGDYVIGLVDLSTYNSIPNIEKGINDKFYYGDGNGWKEIVVNEGAYEIEDIESYLKDRIGQGIDFMMRANNNTLKTELFSKQYSINFEKSGTLAPLLGFSNRILKANEDHESDMPVNIINVDTIRVECNIVRGSYKNGVEGHVIHEFYPTSAPGYKMVEIPQTIIYLPLNCERINNISVTLKDQDGNPVNLRNETLALRLHVKKV